MEARISSGGMVMQHCAMVRLDNCTYSKTLVRVLLHELGVVMLRVSFAILGCIA